MCTHGSIVGRVAEAGGAPVAGATVVIAEGDQPFPEIAAITDADGGFRFGHVLPGAYRLAVHLDQRNGSARVVVCGGRAADLEMQLL